MGLSLISKLLGFLREIFLSYFYGASSTTDAYLVALTIPGVLFTFFSTAIAVGFIPTFSSISNDIEQRNEFVNNIFNILLIVSTIIVIGTVLFSEQLVEILAPGFDNYTKTLAIKFTRLFVLGIYFSSWLSIFVAFLNYFKYFRVVALAGIPFNISILISIVLSFYYNIYWLVLGAVFGKLLEIIYLYPYVRKNSYKYKLTLNLKDKNVKYLFLLSLPLTLSISVNQLNIIVDKSIASSLEVGAISAINYSNYLIQLVVGIFVLSVTTIFFPDLAKHFIDRDFKKIEGLMLKSLKLVNILVIPSAFYFFFKSYEIISFVFERGNFNSSSSLLTSSVFVFLSLGLLPFSYREVLIRVFYAMHNTKTPVVNSIIAVIINILLAFQLSKTLGIIGIAIATTIAAFITTLLLFLSLPKLKLKLDFYSFYKDLLKSIVASAISILLIYKIKDTGLFIILNFIIYILFYTATLFILKNEIVLQVYSKINEVKN